VQHLKQHGCAAVSVEFADGLRRHLACSGDEFGVQPVLETLWLQTAPTSGLAFVLFSNCCSSRDFSIFSILCLQNRDHEL
jgi:hypothetical protein